MTSPREGYTQIVIKKTTREKINELVKKYGDGRTQWRVIDMMVESWEAIQDAKHKQQVDAVPFEPQQNVG